MAERQVLAPLRRWLVEPGTPVKAVGSLLAVSFLLLLMLLMVRTTMA